MPGGRAGGLAGRRQRRRSGCGAAREGKGRRRTTFWENFHSCRAKRARAGRQPVLRLALLRPAASPIPTFSFDSAWRDAPALAPGRAESSGTVQRSGAALTRVLITARPMLTTLVLLQIRLLPFLLGKRIKRRSSCTRGAVHNQARAIISLEKKVRGG